MPEAVKSAFDDELLDVLCQIVGDRVTTAAAIREQHGKDESFHACAPPEAVVFAQTTDEGSRIWMAWAARDVPVIPFGTGTSLEGHVAALHGGVSIDLSQMNEIIQVNAEDMDVTRTTRRAPQTTERTSARYRAVFAPLILATTRRLAA